MLIKSVLMLSRILFLFGLPLHLSNEIALNSIYFKHGVLSLSIFYYKKTFCPSIETFDGNFLEICHNKWTYIDSIFICCNITVFKCNGFSCPVVYPVICPMF